MKLAGITLENSIEVEQSVLQKLFQKLTNGTLSEIEADQLKQWHQQQGVSGIQQHMDEDWAQMPESDELLERMTWERFKPRLDKPSDTPIRNLRPWIAAAAAIVLLFLTGLLYYQSQTATPQIVSVTNTTADTKEVLLQDGTLVWLNRNSTLHYAKHFTDSVRKVVLEGEAFFEVATDSTQPFIVTTGNVQTRVLGTSFNVRAFPDSENVQVALATGKVSVEVRTTSTLFLQAAILSPGEMLSLNKANKSATKGTYEEDTPYAWKNGIIAFQKATVRQVVEVLQNQYGVTFTVEGDSLMQSLLVHRLDAKRMTLQQVLYIIDQATDYRFEKKTDTAFVVKPD